MYGVCVCGLVGTCVYVCMYVCVYNMYLCVYVCMYVLTCTCINVLIILCEHNEQWLVNREEDHS